MKDIETMRAWVLSKKGLRSKIAREIGLSYKTLQIFATNKSYFPNGRTLAKLDAYMTAELERIRRAVVYI